MNDLGWRADGIERALAAGGVPLETYRRPGFTGGRGVRRSDGAGAGGGTYIDEAWAAGADPELRVFTTPTHAAQSRA